MIRFLNEIKANVGYIYDVETKNRSFVKVAKRYQTMGVSNYAFCLLLLNPNLKGVDPHSKDLTQEQKTAIRVECKFNPWYFLREVARVVGQGGDDTPFLANRGNISSMWLFLSHTDFCLIQPRQTGKSIIGDFIHIWVMLFSGYKTTINLITLNDKLRVSNMLRIKRAIKLLPPYLRTLKGEKDNTEEITYSDLDNRLLAHINSDSRDKARETARGQTGPINHGDEFAYWKWIRETFAAALGSAHAAVDNAKLAGNPYGNFFTTTAGKRDDKHGGVAYDMVSKGAIWSEAYFDARDETHLIKMLEAAHHPSYTKFMVNCTFSYKQLGFDNRWAFDLIRKLGLSPDDADRDIFNVWTSGSMNSALTIALSTKIVSSIVTPRYIETFGDTPYQLRWYIPKEHIETFVSRNPCVWGLDTSTANGKDGMALVLREVSTMRVVATSTVTESFIINYAKWLSEIMIKYSNTTLVIERATSADTIIETLIIELTKNNINPFLRIYNKVISNAEPDSKEYLEVTNPRQLHDMGMYQRYLTKGAFGFVMTQSTREEIYGPLLQTGASMSGAGVYDETLAKELVGLEMRNGRVDHSHNSHDDHCVAWLLSHWFLSNTRNLSRYGISPTLVMSRCNTTEEETTTKEINNFERSIQAALRNEINIVLRELKEQTNPLLVASLEKRLILLSKRTYQDGGKPIGIDGLLEQAKQHRKQIKKITPREELSFLV